MTEPVTYEVQCMGSCIIPYIEQFEYDSNFHRKNNKPGYIKPKKEFEEWFKYITKIMYFPTKDHSRGADLTDCLYHNEGDGVPYYDPINQVILANDTVFFEFLDEETALYFKLKFIKE